MVKSKHLFDRLKEKDSYKKFIKDNEKAYLYAIFSTISTEEKEGDKVQFDFIIPEKNKVGIAEYPFDKIKVTEQKIEPQPEKINLEELRVDIEDLQSLAQKEQTKNNDKTKINKIIAVLTNNIWNLTCLTTTLDVIKININALTEEPISFKKENLTNFVQMKSLKK